MERENRLSKLFAIIAFAVSTLLGLAVIFGWHTNNPILIQVHSSFAPMQYNTALGFLLAGLGATFLVYRHLKLMLLCGSVLCVIGLLTLVQYVLGIDIGLDQLFMEHYISTKTSHIGRMAPNTALCFLLVGICFLTYFLFKESSYKIFVLRLLSSLVLVLGTLSILGYVLSLEAAYGWTNLTRMAAHTSVGFISIGIGLLAFLHSITISEKKARSLQSVSVIVSTILFLFTVVLWEEISRQEVSIVQGFVDEEGELIGKEISSKIISSVYSLERMARRWEVAKGTKKENWENDAYNYLEENQALTTLEWVDNTYHVRWVVPLEGNEKALNLNIAFDEKRKAILEGASKKETITITPPLNLVQGYRAFIVYVPIYIEDKFEGFIVGIYNIDALLDTVLNEKLKTDFNVKIYDNGAKVYSLAKASEYDKELIYRADIDLLSRVWNLELSPKTKFLESHHSYLPETILIAGSILAILMGTSIYYAIDSGRRAAQLRRQAVELHKSQAKFRSAMRYSAIGMAIVSPVGRWLEVNDAFCQLVGYSEDDLQEMDYKEITHSEDREKDDELVIALLNKDLQTYQLEKRYIHKNGEIIWTLLSVSLVWDVDGKPDYFISQIQDIRQRKKFEQEREKLVENLTDSNEELERFAHACSHDMQEPLRMIRSFSQKLEMHFGESLEGDEKGKKYLNYVTDGAARAQQLIADILDYSKVQTDVRRLEKVDMNLIVANIKSDFKGKDIKIITEDLPEIVGGKTQLYRLVQNLINNGLKYQKKNSKPEVKISSEETEDEWIFIVKDNGIGIKEEYIGSIFDIFKRLHRASEYQGTGIGLAICKKIVERHEGRMWVESEFGKGSSFYFSIKK